MTPDTGPDSLQFYHTNPLSGGGQPDPAESLGGGVSTNRIRTRAALVTNNIVGTVIEFIGHHNTTGTGLLRVVSASQLAYTAPGDTEGQAVTIANGETHLIVSGNGSAYVRVRRRSTEAMTGVASLTIARVANNAIGMSDQSATTGERYRQVGAKNVGSLEITNLRFWLPASGPRIAIEYPTAGETQLIADDSTAPTGVTWSTATERLDGLHVPSLAADEDVRLWIERASGMVATASPDEVLEVQFTYDVYEG